MRLCAFLALVLCLCLVQVAFAQPARRVVSMNATVGDVVTMSGTVTAIGSGNMTVSLTSVTITDGGMPQTQSVSPAISKTFAVPSGATVSTGDAVTLSGEVSAVYQDSLELSMDDVTITHSGTDQDCTIAEPIIIVYALPQGGV